MKATSVLRYKGFQSTSQVPRKQRPSSSISISEKGKYNNRILEVDMGTFTPLIFSYMGGMSREPNRFYNRLAELIFEKRKV